MISNNSKSFFVAMVLRLVLCCLLASITAGCPLWTSYNETLKRCQCGSSLDGLVDCVVGPNQVSLSVLYCYCMTYNDKLGQATVGQCMAKCHLSSRMGSLAKNRIHAEEYDGLNSDVCGNKGRTGHLCGDCIEGYAPPVYSYSVECVRCNETSYKYISCAYVPLTIFYIIVLLKKISITSHKMSGLVFVCQILTIPSVLKVFIGVADNHHVLHYFIGLVSMWNLDFFRSVYTPFCLHPKLTNMHVIALDYVVAVYPMFLIIATYAAVVLHDRYPLRVSTWRPLQKIFAYIRKEDDFQGSLVQSFAFFLVLSYVKILNTSLELLNPVHPLDIKNKHINQTYLYAAGTVEYFGHEHLPFCILAILITTIFNILPVILLLLYPYNWFRKCLLCGKHSQSLMIFMDAFYGYYKTKPKYFQPFASAYFISLYIELLLFSTFDDPTFGLFAAVHLVTMAFIIIIFQPYKQQSWNKVNCILMLIGSFVFWMNISSNYVHSYEPKCLNNERLSDLLLLFEATVILSLVCYCCVLAIADIFPKMCTCKCLKKQQDERLQQPLIDHEEADNDY